MSTTPPPSGFPEAREARARAEQTPAVVRDAMLARPREVAGITLHPLNLDTLWILEACAHPLATPGADADKLTPLQLAQLVFAFAAPDAALEHAGQEREEGATLSPFDRAAFSYLRTHVPLGEMATVTAALVRLLTEGLATAPGAGGANPPAAG